MAELKLTIGPLSASASANNAKATTTLNNFLGAIGYTGPNTDQAKLNAIVAHLRSYITNRAREYQVKVTSRTAEQAALTDPANAFED